MKTTASLALFGLIQGIAAYPSANRLYVRDCKPGFLVCQDESQFGLCNIDKTAIFMKVAEGTKCVCSGGDCTIAAIDGGAAEVPQPSQDTPTSEASSQIPTAAAPTSESAPQPTQPALQTPEAPAPSPSSAPEPSAQASAAQSAPGGMFKENPTNAEKAPAPQSAQSSAPSPQSTESSATDSDSSSGASGIDIGSGRSYIKTFLGTGSTGAGWPAKSQWASFQSMFAANRDIIDKSCAGFGQADNTPQESADLESAIESVAASSGVDASFIFAVAMQESNGCVRAPTTNYGVTNPGIMQSHNGANSCFNVSPCPKSTIEGMIRDGVEGTSSGDGLKQILAKQTGSGVEKYYQAARVYNSGSIAPSGQLQDGIATHCYASDIANRLIGWSAGVGSCNIS